MTIIWTSFLQLAVLTVVCLAQVSQDSPVLQVGSPVRAPYVVCYVNKWALKREGIIKVTLQDIDPKGCSHVIYTDGTTENNLLTDNAEEGKQYTAAVTALRQKDPNLKILLAIGGRRAVSRLFNEVTSSDAKLNEFVQEAIKILRKYKFNGLDVGWEYPSGPKDAATYVTLLKKLRETFDAEAKTSGHPRLLLTAKCQGYLMTVSESLGTRRYDVAEISKNVDFINLITFGFWTKSWVEHHAALFARKFSTEYQKKLNVDFSAQEWVRQGASKDKLMIGMPFFGGLSVSADKSKFNLEAPPSGGGSPGDNASWVGIVGFKPYYELCGVLKENSKNCFWDGDQQAATLKVGSKWAIGVDDEKSLKAKMEWFKIGGYGGVMVWSLDMDDFRGACGAGKFPLLNVLTTELAGYKIKLPSVNPYDLLDGYGENSLYELDNEIPCQENQLKCNNGQCIERTDRCDGKPQCYDGSDETYTLCKNWPCSRDHFQCKYGGCVGGSSKCNGIQDCVDASDEDATLCANQTSPDGCVAPPASEGTDYISGFCNASDTAAICNVMPGSILTFGSHLHVRCSDGYSLLKDPTMTCSTKGVFHPFPPPTCQRTCPPLEKYPNVEYECKLLEYEKSGHSYYRDVPCDLPMVHGTQVTLSCPVHFQPQVAVITCMEDGTWNEVPIMDCVPLCGIKRKSIKIRIEDGEAANATDYPWHAGLYKQIMVNGKPEYEYQCGGSLVRQYTVLTAAHCREHPSDKMFVALGKQNIQWDVFEKGAQKFEVKEWISYPKYTADKSFIYDLALLILSEPVTFGDYLYPVCVNDSPKRFTDSRASGTIPGFGKTEIAEKSDSLNSGKIPFIPREECEAFLTKNSNQDLLTYDKFCAGYVSNSGQLPKASTGDSGGGLIFKDKDRGLSYVVGIASTTIPQNKFGAYINVSTYFTWIIDTMK